METILIFDTKELFHCLFQELRPFGFEKESHLRMYAQTWIKVKLNEIFDLPLWEMRYSARTNYEVSRLLPAYLDAMVIRSLRSRVGGTSNYARVSFDFDVGNVIIRYQS